MGASPRRGPRRGAREGQAYALYLANGTSLDEPHWHSYPAVWTPSIYMLRWASRITLEITGVRVERLQEISEQDAWDEGFPDPRGANRNYPDRARYWFKCLWEEINSKRPGCSWDANPWVWAITFRRIKP